MKKLKFNGKVFSGKGRGKEFLDLQWVKQQINAIVGFIPYSGTLNIQLSGESVARKKLLENTASLKVYPDEGYRSGKLFRASIGTLDCAIVMPEIAGYPPNVLEVIAPVNLREQLQLVDGDVIAVTVNL